ncbi:TPA: YlcI/YnfO family protein [Escherichia coli]|nr:YlcI/YnfO family protein [Escherichia coli]
MIEQINIALEHKGSGNFSAWVIEACRRRLATDATHLRPVSMTNNEK